MVPPDIRLAHATSSAIGDGDPLPPSGFVARAAAGLAGVDDALADDHADWRPAFAADMAADKNPRMKVAIFHASLPSPDRKIGGVEAAVHRLATTLWERGDVDVTVISCDAPPAGAVYPHVRLFRAVQRSRFLRLFVLPAVFNFYDLRQYHVVHTHGDDWFWLRRKVATVRTLHGSALREAQNSTSLRRKLLHFLLYPLEWLAARLADRSVAVGADTNRIYVCDAVIGNGVDLSRFKAAPKTAVPTLVFIGVWGGRKRGEFAFRTFVDTVLPAYPQARLHMVSDHADPHPNVIWHKWLDDAALAEILASAWLFFYPSTYEGFGIPYIEAMASGTAIVTTRNAGAEELLDHGRLGWVCSDEDFGRRAVQALGDGAARAQFEARGLARVGDFSADVIAEKYVRLYAEAIRRRAVG